MKAEVEALAEQHDELDALLAAFDDGAWDTPSRCDGWTVGDVVLHLAQTDEMALASLEGRLSDVVARLSEGLPPARDVDEGVALMVARERGRAGADVYERWRTGARALVAAFGRCDGHERVEWVAGQLSARTLASTRLAETWIHTGDVAGAIDIDPAPSDRLRFIARLAWRTLPYALARAGRTLSGPVAFELRAPTGEQWDFGNEGTAVTTIRGDALDLCLVAGRRADASTTSLTGNGPDAAAVLELVRTYA